MSYEGQSTDPQGVGDSMMNKPTRGSVSMNINLVGEKESPSEEKGTENGAFVESQTSFRVNEVKDNASNRVEKAGARSRLQVQQKQQQPQGSVVCWEKFLHVESIRVLLVENDECTRHVVTALLRNCNYEVLAAANGLQAWKVLEDLSNHIDIVLTEVVMPYIPGIPLLSKIMSHKTRRNIPVIMMSSHDSMSLVFKCLSKGAVDFLVKPIRKNELKILWQHVWRRCQSSSGSGSESGTQTQKSVKSESSEKSDRGASNDGGNDVNTSLNVGDESDNGSGAQSSWTKKAVEIVSTQATSPMNQVAELPDSTCAQVIRSNAESSDCDRVHIGIAREYQDEKRVDSKVECKDKEPETIIHTNAEPKAENPMEVPCAVIDRETKYLLEFNDSSIIKQTCMGQNYPTAEALLNKNKDGSYETSNPQSDGRKSYCPREVANVLDENSEPPFDPGERNIELSLKRLRGIQDTGRPTQDDRYVLHRSEQSAFSRYNACSNFSKVPDGIASRQSISDITVKVAKQEPVHVQGHSTEHAVYLISSDGVGNNLDICSTTKNLPPQQLIINDSCEAIFILNGIHSAFRPVQKDLRYSGQQTTNSVSAKGSQKNLQIQPPHENYHHLHDVERQPSSNDDESSLKRMAEDAPQFGSTNALGGPWDGKGRDYSSSRSISRSNHGSSNAVNASWTNAEGDVGQARRSGSGDSSGSGSGNRVEEDKVAHRIAALSKFRQKKKDRCFAKKVRYQSRKELAEQRPRVRGQFVKHSATDSSKGTSDEL